MKSKPAFLSWGRQTLLFFAAHLAAFACVYRAFFYPERRRVRLAWVLLAVALLLLGRWLGARKAAPRHHGSDAH